MKKLSLSILCLCVTTCSAWAEQPPEQQWVAEYDAAEHRDKAYSVDIDSFGNVCVSGTSVTDPNTGYYNYTTIKYGSDGNQLWLRHYTGPRNRDDATDMAIDNFDNIYVTGYSPGNDTIWDYATVKYDPNGTELWVSRYDGTGSGDFAYAIAVDAEGNAYVTGASIGVGTSYDYATVKYDPNGYELWVARYNGPKNYTDRPEFISVDDEGNIYVAGYCDSWSFSSPKPGDILTIKYDTNGNELWTARYNCPENGDDYPKGMAVDSSGNVYVIRRPVTTNYDNTIIKYDPNGNELWTLPYPPGDARGIATDYEENVYVTGPNDSTYQTIKYDPNGNELWSQVHDWAGDGDCPEALVIDNAGCVYVTGLVYDITTAWDYATVKYDSNGNEMWAVQYNKDHYDVVQDIAVDNLGNVCVTGYNEGIGNLEDFLTIKYTQHDYCIGQIGSDFDDNCKVDFIDFSLLAEAWFFNYNFADLATFADEWLKCNFALEEDCWQ